MGLVGSSVFALVVGFCAQRVPDLASESTYCAPPCEPGTHESAIDTVLTYTSCLGIIYTHASQYLREVRCLSDVTGAETVYRHIL